jgi:cytochrome c
MSELSTNKVLGAILSAGLLTVGLGVIVPEFFPLIPPAKAGYAVAIPADVSGASPAAPAALPPPDWGTVLPKADIAAGKATTAICQACHIFAPSGANLIGPGLWGVLGRQPGTHPGFAYSQAMIDFGKKQKVWDYQHVFEFIKGPQAYIPGTKMTFSGLPDRQTRINVIAYLHTLGSTLPIPPPNPAAAATASKGSAAATPSAGPASTATGAGSSAASRSPGTGPAPPPTPDKAAS